ncbi:hypothetical protein RMSM_05612 [Rhodopirellula maiorica SM1]|uniref:Uncharacterized protein n=1 Tax=Rhodopirellula maiorica SM1 TaxID=1265738 RepID=M5RU15_9BACT|nr:hypothetical protein RMSM_05612 [Rhodopirellula maiorica SM1]
MHVPSPKFLRAITSMSPTRFSYSDVESAISASSEACSSFFAD